jgi:peptide/nickel transport system permease protein
MHFMPGDPINNMVPRDPKFNPEVRKQLVAQFHLNDSLPEQFVYYVYNTVTLNWGTSYTASSRKVIDIITTDMQWTLLLVGASTVMTILIGMVVGAYSAYRRGGAFDIAATSAGLFFYGMPVFWFAMLLQLLFSSHPLGMAWWPQFPTGGYYDTDKFGSVFSLNWGTFWSLIDHLIVPSMVLSIGYIAGVSMVMRSSLIDVMTEDFIITARAKGLTDYQVLRKHALPNGMPPMIALIAMDIAFIIGGAYQVEVIFRYPGIGYRTLDAINNLDFPILQFIVIIGGVAVVIANFIADMMLYWIDPRIKVS